MRILGLIKPNPGVTIEDLRPLMLPEERKVWAAYKAGLVRDFAIQQDPPTVMFIFEAPDKATIAAELATWPMFQAAKLSHELFEMGPWLPLEVLFGPQAEG